MSLPRKTAVLSPESMPPLPKSWGGLSWRQLTGCWQAKMRYGGNADVARAAALLYLIGCSVCRRGTSAYSAVTGEPVYRLKDGGGNLWTVTPRELSQMARQALPWFDWPYGDQGEKAEYDGGGKMVRPARDAVPGYVGPMRDALILPEETVTVGRQRFALPQLVCSNVTWQQYRSLQGIAPQLFLDGVAVDDAMDMQAQFLAHILVPRSFAVLDTSGGSIRLRPHWEYRYNMEQADGLVAFWRRMLERDAAKPRRAFRAGGSVQALFHICFQVYQTSITYYASAYPLLFEGGGRQDPMRDALQGEVGTINTVMKYAGYAEQQQVYDSMLPFVLDILNTMSREAKQIEAMNAKIGRKK